ncbi:MAG: sigma-70 family RNA polymerase sigma factor [Bacteroidetes bacterium]|nr:sigma-70 family RNA polymerase sigma factor [Bacteroidota bacterium]
MFLRSKLFSKKNTLPETDSDLIARFRSSNNPHIIGELFNRYTHLVFGVCMKYLKDEEEAKDAVMQIFENLFKDLNVHNVENFKSWLHTVTKNYCLMELRKARAEAISFENLPDEFMESADVEHLDGVPDIIEDKMMEAVKHLNEEQKTCIELFYLHKKSYIEITQITGYSLKQVKSHVQNGKRNLKIILSN